MNFRRSLQDALQKVFHFISERFDVQQTNLMYFDDKLGE